MGDPSFIPTHNRERHHSRKTGFFHYCPLILYLLLAFIAIQLGTKYFGTTVRTPLFAYHGYALSWVEILYLAAATIGMLEMLKVSEPDVDNVLEVLAMLGVWLVYFGIFILGATGAQFTIATVKISFFIFNNTEFLMLTLISAFQIFVAFLVNTRTLQVQIAN